MKVVIGQENLSIWTAVNNETSFKDAVYSFLIFGKCFMFLGVGKKLENTDGTYTDMERTCETPQTAIQVLFISSKCHYSITALGCVGEKLRKICQCSNK